MKSVSARSRTLEASPIRKMFNFASSVRDVVDFALGEPDFTTPLHIIDAAKLSLDRGETHYTPNAGIMPLREVLARSAVQEYGIMPDPVKEIVVTAGGMEALFLAMMAVIDPGDEVILSDPGWPNHARQVEMCGGVPRPVRVYEQSGFLFDADNLRKAVSERTKILLLNSPSNPTGGVADEGNLRKISQIAVEYDLIVISDEVYHRFLYDNLRHRSIACLDGMRERTLIVDSFSKTYAMTGWRVGFAIGPEFLISQMIKLQENVVGSVNTQAQYAAIAALTGTQEPLEQMIQAYDARRHLMVDGLNAIERISCPLPRGAFYCFANIGGTGLSSEEFAMRLIRERGTIVVPGSGFGHAGEGYVRVSYATSEDTIERGLSRIKDFVGSL